MSKSPQSEAGGQVSPAPTGQGNPIAVVEIEPWPEPVDGAELLNATYATIRRYVVLEPAQAYALALWIIHTHAIDTATISPRLAITSPEKRCGKTTLLHLLSALVARPKSAANVTTAILFRVIDTFHPTLLIDEADTFLAGKDEMRGIINAGHSRNGGIFRNIKVGDDWQPREFSVWGAVAVAAIGKMPTTIEDRSITICLRRRRVDETIERLRIDRLDQFAPLARQSARWVEDHSVELSDADPDVPSVLNDRAADNWRPLFSIADAAGGDWPERARNAALALSRHGDDGADVSGIGLLADIRELFDGEPSGVLFTSEIVAALHNREDRPWAEYERGRAITPHQVAALLRPFHIPTNQTQRRGARTGKGYRAKDFEDSWARYLPPQDR